MDKHHQVAFKLPNAAFQTLKRLSEETRKPYADVVADALNALAASSGASAALVGNRVIYASLPDQDRRRWRSVAIGLRGDGLSHVAIAKELYRAHHITGADGLPLGTSTIRGMLSV